MSATGKKIENKNSWKPQIFNVAFLTLQSVSCLLTMDIIYGPNKWEQLFYENIYQLVKATVILQPPSKNKDLELQNITSTHTKSRSTIETKPTPP